MSTPVATILLCILFLSIATGNVGSKGQIETPAFGQVGLSFSSYLGGSGSDIVNSITQGDSKDKLILVGQTTSANFPVEGISLSKSLNGAQDAYLSIITNNSLTYSTYFGGSGEDTFHSVTTWKERIIAAGKTSSKNYPLFGTPLQNALNGTTDGIISMFSSGGTSVIWSTYLGGSGDDEIRSVAVGDDGAIYITGWTTSQGFFETSTEDSSSITSCFVAVVNSTGQLLFSKEIKGNAPTRCTCIAVDSSGSFYVVGITFATDLEHIVNPDNSSMQSFWMSFNVDYSVKSFQFVGGSGTDYISGLAIGSNAVYLAGFTSSVDFPVTILSRNYSGEGSDAFVTSYNKNTGILNFSTLLGGNNTDELWSISIDKSENVYVSGFTQSSNFPVSSDAFATNLISPYSTDGFVSIFTSQGSLAFSSYFGGDADDCACSIKSFGTGYFYAAGWTLSKTLELVSPIQSSATGDVTGLVFSGRSQFIGATTSSNTIGTGQIIGVVVGAVFAILCFGGVGLSAVIIFKKTHRTESQEDDRRILHALQQHLQLEEEDDEQFL